MADRDFGGARHSEVYLDEYQPPAFSVETVILDFHLDPVKTTVIAKLTMHRCAPGALILNGCAIHLHSVALNGETLTGDRYVVDDKTLSISEVPDRFTLETVVEISPAQNTELSGLYMSGAGFFTQCEPEGFRRITYFPDRPDVMARYTVTLHADKAKFPVLLSNGNKIAEGQDGSNHWAQWEDPHPKPSYLFALVAADLASVADHFITRSGRRVALNIYVPAGDLDKTGHAMHAVKNAMKWDEDTFGLEYDLDVFNIAAVSDFNSGAMENKGLNIFNTVLVLASPETATDRDFQNIERVVAHEYFHNWTGNRVTCRDWFQLSLKEGLTVFRDQEYTADQFSAAVKRIGDVRLLRSTQFRNDAGPLAHAVRPRSYLEINNFYTTTIYEKGAEIVRMYRTLMGRQLFRAGMDKYIENNDNHAATVEDFFEAMQSVTDIDLSQIMNWYEQAGTPEISFSEAFDPEAHSYTLTLRQNTRPTPGQPEKKPFLIPVELGLLSANGDEICAQTVILNQPEQIFTFHSVDAPPTPSLFRNFSAPVKLLGMSRDRLAFLAAHDTDPFNRWDALQQYASLVLLDAVAVHQAGGAFTLDRGLRDSIASLLANAAEDPAFTAEAVILPGESLLADSMDIVDPDAIRFVRQKTLAALGTALRDEFTATLKRFRDLQAGDISPQAMARRAVKNAALSYLSASGQPELAAAQYAEASNMTDAVAALVCLAEFADVQRDNAFTAFYEKWRGNALVINKWFAIQAQAGAPDTLERVQSLLKHKDFDLLNPNRVRSLIGNFSANQAKFHDKSGAGYKILADTVLALDSKNPQTAARLSTAFNMWRRYDSHRQELMRGELTRIVNAENLSSNSFEMASKALA